METKEFLPAIYNVIFKNVCIDNDYGKIVLGLILSTIFDRKIIVKDILCQHYRSVLKKKKKRI